MNVIIPPRRRDKKTSFKKLVEYVSTRDEKKASEVIAPNDAAEPVMDADDVSMRGHKKSTEVTAPNDAAESVPDADDVSSRGERKTSKVTAPEGTDEHTPVAEFVATPGFGQLVNYVGRKSTASVTQVHSISPEGIQRVSSGEVLCETNCWSLGSAAAEMNMTAMQNRHCKDAVYHFILSWQSDETPSPDDIFKSARYCLDSLGMKDHQYVAAIHEDTGNIHCHVSTNRVHPETFRAQNMWNDADTLQKCCRVLERELGFKVDNGSWHMDESGDLHRTRRGMPSAPRGAAKREIFSDRESLHGYAVRETRQALSDDILNGKMGWERLHNTLYTRGLGLREQSGGLAVYDLLNPEGVSVKASDIHPDISLTNMLRAHGKYKPAPPVYNPDRPEDGMLHMHTCYMPQLHVRDQEARRERREARAIARDILRARYDAYRTGWEKPDLRVGERFRQITAHCVVVKASVRDSVRDPLMRKLMYRVAEFEKMKAMAELRLQLREERQTLKETGENRPLSWKSWVEREAVRGDVAALSQLRGWAYREKRNAKKRGAQNQTPEAVVYFGPGDDAPLLRNPTHDVRLNKDGCVEYQRNGITEIADYGNRVEVYPRNEADQETWWLAAAVTARRSGENAVINGEPASVTRLLDSGAVLNANNAVHRFSVGNKLQQDRVDVTESWFREKYRNGTHAEAAVPRYDSAEAENVPVRINRDLPRP